MSWRTFVCLFTGLLPRVFAGQAVLGAEDPVKSCLSAQSSARDRLAGYSDDQKCPMNLHNAPSACEIAKDSSATPWTHEPECLRSPYNNQTYCLYTSTTFHSPRGITLLVHPDTASRAASHQAFTRSSRPRTSTTPPYESVSIPHKGHGLLATRSLQRGDLIHAHPPIGLFSVDALMADHASGYQYLHQGVRQLGPEGQTLFWELGNSRVVEDGIEGWESMGRVETNGFGTAWEDEELWVIFPESARLNHDCRPNTMSHFDPETLLQYVYASRPIAMGEELTVTYIPILIPHADRQALLRTQWRFTCTCHLCSRASADETVSDSRASRLAQLHARVSASNTHANPTDAETLLHLYEQEEIYAGMAGAWYLAAQAWSNAGDWERARMYAVRVASDVGMMGRKAVEEAMDGPLDWAFVEGLVSTTDDYS